MSTFYSTLLRCVGGRQETFGQLDSDLDVKTMQSGPLPAILA